MIGITEIIGEIVKSVSEKLGYDVNYIFGNDEYIKEMLDEYSASDTVQKFPLVALFCPIMEDRGRVGYVSCASLNIIIACSTIRSYSNEEREQHSFKETLRPIYGMLIETLLEDRRLDFGYDPIVKHKYSENYSYGRYGAFTSTSREVSEPIDAIDIRNLEIKIRTLNNCRNGKN